MAWRKRPAWVDDFHKFIMRGSVVDLAVGIVIGAAFTAIVNSLVKDIINPLLGVLTGGADFSNVFFALNGHHYATLAEAQHAAAPTVNVGLFVNAVIQFLIIGFAVFWVVKALTRMHLREQPAPAPPPGPTPTEQLLGEIRDLLKESAPTGGGALPQQPLHGP